MYSCPACGNSNVANQARCKCGADLTLLQCLEAVANAWFNRALSALADDRPGRALEWLSACCAARPTDAEARLVQAKVWARLGRWREASDALDRAEEVGVSSDDLQAVRDVVREAEEKHAKKAAKPQRRRKEKKRGKSGKKSRRKRK